MLAGDRMKKSLRKESVWDYPRPPRVEPARRRVRVLFKDQWVADSEEALRVLETSHPPTYYISPACVRMDQLEPVQDYSTYCEWKGQATYFNLVVGRDQVSKAAWCYRDPKPGYEQLKDFIAFYPGRVTACYLDEEEVQAQPGDFYGGWITDNIEGPFKGGAGTRGW